MEKESQKNGRQVHSPHPENIHEKNIRTRQKLLASPQSIVDKNPEAVVVVLLVLVEHINGKLEKNAEHGNAPRCRKNGQKTEQQKGAEEAPVNPVRNDAIRVEIFHSKKKLARMRKKYNAAVFWANHQPAQPFTR